MDAEIVRTFQEGEITAAGIDLPGEVLQGPSATWTYLINENPGQFSNLPALLKLATTTISRPLFTVRSLYQRIFAPRSREA